MNRVLHKTKLIVLVAVVLLLGGCASTQKLSDADRAIVKSANINSTVTKGDVFLLAPSGANIGLMFGAVGGLAVSGALNDSRKTFADYLDKNAISIEKIVRKEIELELRQSGKLVVTSDGNTTGATINISVPQYGFGVTHLLGSKVVPVMQIKCDLVDSGGKLLWSANERMLPSIASPMESTTWETLHDDPKQIEERWRLAAKHLAKGIVGAL